MKLFLLVALWTLAVYGQNKDHLTNEEVVWLVTTKVPSETIIKTIQDAQTANFKFSPEDLALLRSFNVPDDVLRAMTTKAHGRTSVVLGQQGTPPKKPAETKPLEWKNGVVVEIGTERKSQVTGIETTGTGQNASTQTTSERWSELTFEIDGADKIYFIRQVVGGGGALGLISAIRGGIKLTVGSMVHYAVEGSTMHLLADDSKYHRLRIVRVRAKSAQ